MSRNPVRVYERQNLEGTTKMPTETYTCNRFRSVGKFEYCADFAQAASPIMVLFDNHGTWQSVPFQVADTRHDRRRAEKMIAEYFA